MIVLKILLIVLLVIVGLLLLILFFPVHYSLHGKSNGAWKLYADASWLFYLVFLRAYINLEDQAPKVVLRVLGIPITLVPKKEKKQKKKKNQDQNPGESVPAENPEDPENTENTDSEAEASGAETDTDTGTDEGEGKPGKKKPHLLEKIKALPATISKIRTEVLDPRNKEALKHIIAELKGLLSHYKPRGIRTNLVFSTGDPAMTGQVLGVLSMVPLVYEPGNRLAPDFTADNAYIEGRFRVTGHIILFFALTAAVRLIVDRNIRRLIKHVKTLKG